MSSVTINTTNLTSDSHITDNAVDNATISNNNENDLLPTLEEGIRTLLGNGPPTLERQRTWVDGRLMLTQTNLLIVGYIRRFLVKNHYEPYELEIVQIIVKSLGDIFNTKRLWNEMSQQKYNILMDWLRMNGAQFQNCSLRQVNGIFTSTDTIKQGTIFAKIPIKCIITNEIAKESPIGQKIESLQTTEQIQLRSQHTYMAAYLVLERQKAEESKWWPYISSLPVHFDEMPIHFDEENLAQLKGSFTIQKIQQRQESLQLEYDTLSDLFSAEGISYDEFVWARLVVINRIFGLRINDVKSSGLVPWADLIDHAPPAPNRVKWTFDDNGQQFIVKANSNMKKDSELFVTYGRKCNSRFFVNYGFVLEQENMDNEAVMAFKIIGDRRLYQNISINENDETEFQFSRLYNQRKVQEVFGFLRNIYADEEEQSALQYTMGSNHPLSIQNEKRVLNALNESAIKGLNRFDTSLAFDNELLKDRSKYPLKSNKRNILLMRKGEKEVLMFYRQLKDICVELLSMNIEEIRQRLKSESATMSAPLMQYIQDVIIGLKKQQKMIEERERRKREWEKQAFLEQKQKETDDIHTLVHKKFAVFDEKMEKMNKQINALLGMNQEKDKQIKVLNDKVGVLEDRVMELEHNLNVNELETFFSCEEVDLPQYIQLFVENGITDMNGLKEMTNDELKELGIQNMGHRKKILNAIEIRKLFN